LATIGYIATYIAPLAFVLMVTMGKEALDDYQRYLRDKESNSTRYLILDRSVSQNIEDGLLTRSVSSAKLKVGDMVVLEKNMRIPADMVLLRTSEGPAGASGAEGTKDESGISSFAAQTVAGAEDTSGVAEGLDGDEGGACFVRTDQLDGETDWKLRIAVTVTQPMSDSELVRMKGSLYGM
jgi:phospholipid-translocating ATPase